jgi:hypothetical protein
MKFTFEIKDGRVVSSSGRDTLQVDDYKKMLQVIALYIVHEFVRLS